MKITLQKIDDDQEEIIIRYRQMTERIDGIIRYVEGKGKKLLGVKDGQQFLVDVDRIFYAESVDGVTYLYTAQNVYGSDLTLAFCEALYGADGFFRCSKSMVVNIYHMERLKSIPGNRIDATMDNGEHVIISRRYAKELRNILKGERE